MKKVIAWTLLALVSWGVYAGVKTFKNPWAAGAMVSPIAAVLPLAHDGCSTSKDCFHD